MKKKPSISGAVAFINACVGATVVRNVNCLSVTESTIEFEIKVKRNCAQPLNFVLTRLWRVLGGQSATRYSQVGTVLACYEWHFVPPAGKLHLQYRNNGQVVIGLVNEPVERRSRGEG